MSRGEIRQVLFLGVIGAGLLCLGFTMGYAAGRPAWWLEMADVITKKAPSAQTPVKSEILILEELQGITDFWKNRKSYLAAVAVELGWSDDELALAEADFETLRPGFEKIERLYLEWGSPSITPEEATRGIENFLREFSQHLSRMMTIYRKPTPKTEAALRKPGGRFFFP